MTWFQKLEALLIQAGKPTEGIGHCAKVVRHELAEFLPSGEDLRSKIARILQRARVAGPIVFSGISSGLDAACALAFPGSVPTGTRCLPVLLRPSNYPQQLSPAHPPSCR
jgi:hypothetical protein